MDAPFIYVTRQISETALQRISHLHVDIWKGNSPPDKNTLIEAVSKADGLLCLLTDPVDAEVIQRGARLKVISQMAVGFDNIDIRAATQAGIPVGHTPGVLTETCADFTFGLILAVARRIPESDREVRQNIWRPWGPDVLIGQEVNGSTLGLVGFGRIGQAVARRATGFNMKILYYDPSADIEIAKKLNAEFVELNDLLSRSDFVSIHTTLNDETYHLVNHARLQKMKNSAYLINTARGPIVDPDALEWALKNCVIKGAALDVFDPEPIPEGHELLNLKNLVITPHIASASNQTRENMAGIAVENLLAGIESRHLPYCANPQVYER